MKFNGYAVASVYKAPSTSFLKRGTFVNLCEYFRAEFGFFGINKLMVNFAKLTQPRPRLWNNIDALTVFSKSRLIGIGHKFKRDLRRNEIKSILLINITN